MASMGTKEIVKLRERVKKLEAALHDVVRTYERDHWGYEGDCIFMANTAALALGLERVHVDGGGYFIPGTPPKFFDENRKPIKP